MKTTTRAHVGGSGSMVFAGVLSLGALTLVGMGLGGCEKPAPPSAAQPSSRAPLGGLSQDPQSLLGKSAQTGKEAVKQAEQAQAAASGVADEISGAAGVVTVAGLEFRPPSSWSKGTPANRMQSANYTVTGTTQCVWLAGIGGSVEQNLERWRGQVINPDTGQPAETKVEKRTIAGVAVTLVSMAGTYSSMAGGAPTAQPGSGFRGAIIEAPAGLLFVRMTGPQAEVEGATQAFEQMILGMRKP